MGRQGAKGGPGRDQASQWQGVRDGGEPLVVSHCSFVYQSACGEKKDTISSIQPIMVEILKPALIGLAAGEEKKVHQVWMLQGF
jgi:hypothetical protein